MKRSGFRRVRPKPNVYNTRERAPDSWWIFVKSQRCFVVTLHEIGAFIDPARPSILTPCGGEIEADHAGERGLSHKGPDAIVYPICTYHHRERTDFSGAFKHHRKEDMRDFLSIAVQHTHNLARLAGVEIPSC